MNNVIFYKCEFCGEEKIGVHNGENFFCSDCEEETLLRFDDNECPICCQYDAYGTGKCIECGFEEPERDWI